MARHLDAWGVASTSSGSPSPERLRGDAATQWTILERSGIDPDVVTSRRACLWNGADWVVDGLLRHGADPPGRRALARVVEAVNGRARPILAWTSPRASTPNRPSRSAIAVRATFTATFVAPKLGFGQPGASSYLGEVRVVDIGVPRMLLERFEGPR